MRARSKTLLLTAALVAAAPAGFHAQGGPPSPSASQGYHVIKQTLLGGDGGWDYVTVDPDAHRIYIPRGTHVMVLDEATHKVLADIPGLKGIHGVAVAPEVNRGVITGNDPQGGITGFHLKTDKGTSTIPISPEELEGIEDDTPTKRGHCK